VPRLGMMANPALGLNVKLTSLVPVQAVLIGRRSGAVGTGVGDVIVGFCVVVVAGYAGRE
jgi:hypothetical protein